MHVHIEINQISYYKYRKGTMYYMSIPFNIGNFIEIDTKNYEYE